MGCIQGKAVKLQHPVTLAILGIDNAGKSTAAVALKGDPLENVAPTIGFSQVDFDYKKQKVTLFDLGGGKNIRNIWKNYLAEVYGIIFVVDACDPERIDESSKVLSELLRHEHVREKSVLLFANKQDKEGAMDKLQVIDRLQLDELVESTRTNIEVRPCIASKGTGTKCDKALTEGIRWLLSDIARNWETLHARVERDKELQNEARQRERQAKMERLRIRQEQQEKEEREERRRQGLPSNPNSEDEGDQGDPFKLMTPEELEKKAQEEKARKGRKSSKVGEESSIAPVRRSSDIDTKPDPFSADSLLSAPKTRASQLPPLEYDSSSPRSRHRKKKRAYLRRSQNQDGTPRTSRSDTSGLSTQENGLSTEITELEPVREERSSTRRSQKNYQIDAENTSPRTESKHREGSEFHSLRTMSPLNKDTASLTADNRHARGDSVTGRENLQRIDSDDSGVEAGRSKFDSPTNAKHITPSSSKEDLLDEQAGARNRFRRARKNKIGLTDDGSGKPRATSPTALFEAKEDSAKWALAEEI